MIIKSSIMLLKGERKGLREKGVWRDNKNQNRNKRENEKLTIRTFNFAWIY